MSRRKRKKSRIFWRKRKNNEFLFDKRLYKMEKRVYNHKICPTAYHGRRNSEYGNPSCPVRFLCGNHLELTGVAIPPDCWNNHFYSIRKMNRQNR